MCPARLPCLLSVLLLTATDAHPGGPAAPVVFRGKTLAEWSGELHSVDARTRRRAATALALGPFGKQAVPALLGVPRNEKSDLPLPVLMALSHLAPDAPEVAPLLAPYVSLSSLQSNSLPIETSRLGPTGMPLILDQIRKRGLEHYDVFSGVNRSALPLFTAALKDEGKWVRAVAATTLGNLKAEAAGAVPQLLLLLHDKEIPVRACAMEALVKIGLPPGTMQLFVERLRDSEDAGAAASALASLGKPGIVVLRQVFASASSELRITILDGAYSAGRDALPLLLDGLQHPDEEVRRRSATGLRRSPAALDEVLPQLIAALADKDAKTRDEIVTCLGLIVPPRREVVLLLAKTMLDADSDVSSSAAAALKNFGPHARAAVPQLLDALKHLEPGVRYKAAAVLGAMGSVRRDVVLALCASLKDSAEIVRIAAADAIGRLGPDTLAIERASVPAGSVTSCEIVQPALRHGLHDKQQAVRMAMASALVRLGDRSEKLAKQLGLEALDPFGYLFGTRSYPSRQWALMVLGEMGKAALPALPFLLLTLREDNRYLSTVVLDLLAALDPDAREVIPTLRYTLETSESPGTRHAATLALLKLGKAGHGVLRELLSLGDDSPNAYYILGGLQSAGVEAKPLYPSLLRFTRGSDGKWCVKGLRMLGASGVRSEEARRIMLQALADEDDSVRSIACSSLGAMGAEARAAIPALVGCLLEPRPQQRCKAIQALRQIGPNDARVLPILVELLTDPDETVRKEAVEALGAGGRPARSALRHACSDCGDSVRVAAACALSRIGDRDECKRVLRSVMLDGKDTRVRVEACQALWKRERTPEVVPVLAELLRDDNARDAAADALCELGGALDDVRAFMRPLLKHELRAVRAAAWCVLEKTSPELTTALVNAR